MYVCVCVCVCVEGGEFGGPQPSFSWRWGTGKLKKIDV